MSDSELQPVDGLVLIALRIRDEDRREQAVHRLENLLPERITPTIYELSVADWDEGLCDEEIRWFMDLLEGTRDCVIVWRFVGSGFSRFTIGESR